MYENSSTSAELEPSLRLYPFLCSLLAVLLASALWPVSSFASENQASERPIVVLLSLDGFRADYLEKYPDQSTNLKRLADSGLAAAGSCAGISQQHVF
jgi:predicted AlkP superfamily pyrophosphatase or phosphodiesterase